MESGPRVLIISANETKIAEITKYMEGIRDTGEIEIITAANEEEARKNFINRCCTLQLIFFDNLPYTDIKTFIRELLESAYGGLLVACLDDLWLSERMEIFNYEHLQSMYFNFHHFLKINPNPFILLED